MLNVQPKQQPIQVRGTPFTLQAMECKKNPVSGIVEGPLLDWAEIQVLCCREKVEAAERLKRGQESELRECLTHLLCADVNLVVRALRCDPQFAFSLTGEEKADIIAAQDALNQTANLGPLLGGHARSAFVDNMGEPTAAQ